MKGCSPYFSTGRGKRGKREEEGKEADRVSEEKKKKIGYEKTEDVSEKPRKKKENYGAPVIRKKKRQKKK